MKEISLSPDERLDRINEDLTLIQRRNGLTFGTDAFLLSAFCRGQKNAVAADFGCGTGVISLLLAARGRYRRIFGVEVQESFADLAARNVALSSLSDTVSVLCRDIRTLTPADFGCELDVVVANPPYMRTTSGFASPHDEKQIARHEVAGGIDDFAAAAARCLKYGGKLYLVYRPDRLQSLFSALERHGLAPKRAVFVHDHAAKEPSMLLLEAHRGGAEGLVLLPPLILHDTDEQGVKKELSPRAQAIYDTGSF